MVWGDEPKSLIAADASGVIHVSVAPAAVVSRNPAGTPPSSSHLPYIPPSPSQPAAGTSTTNSSASKLGFTPQKSHRAPMTVGEITNARDMHVEDVSNHGSGDLATAKRR